MKEGEKTQLQIIDDSLAKIEKWLQEDGITESRIEALLRCKKRYEEWRIMNLCGCDLKKYLEYCENEKRKQAGTGQEKA